MVRALKPEMLLPTEIYLQCQKWSPYKGRGTVSTTLCAIIRELALPEVTNTFLKPPCAQDLMNMPTHLPLSHLVQNLSKQIVPTDNMAKS